MAKKNVHITLGVSSNPKYCFPCSVGIVFLFASHGTWGSFFCVWWRLYGKNVFFWGGVNYGHPWARIYEKMTSIFLKIWKFWSDAETFLGAYLDLGKWFALVPGPGNGQNISNIFKQMLHKINWGWFFQIFLDGVWIITRAGEGPRAWKLDHLKRNCDAQVRK